MTPYRYLLHVILLYHQWLQVAMHPKWLQVQEQASKIRCAQRPELRVYLHLLGLERTQECAVVMTSGPSRNSFLVMQYRFRDLDHLVEYMTAELSDIARDLATL